jgi:hypothetical protein
VGEAAVAGWGQAASGERVPGHLERGAWSDTTTEVQTGDAWLSTFLPQVLESPEYAAGTTAVFITWDEGAGADQHIATLVIAPSTPAGTTSASTFDHYSLLRTTEEMLGLTTYIGEAANTVSMRSAFGPNRTQCARAKEG